MMTSSGKLVKRVQCSTCVFENILHFGNRINPGIWDQNLAWSLTEEQSKDIERTQKRGMKIICPEKTYEQALIECGMELENRREKMCIKLINDMKRDVIQINFIILNVEPNVLAIVFIVCAFANIILQLITYNNF